MMGMDEPYIPDDALFEMVHMGHEAALFLKHTPMGREMHDKALHNYRAAVKDFEQLSIEQIMNHPERVVAIRHKMDVTRAFIAWVGELVGTATSAENELVQRDQSEATID